LRPPNFSRCASSKNSASGAAQRRDVAGDDVPRAAQAGGEVEADQRRGLAAAARLGHRGADHDQRRGDRDPGRGPGLIEQRRRHPLAGRGLGGAGRDDPQVGAGVVDEHRVLLQQPEQHAELLRRQHHREHHAQRRADQLGLVVQHHPQRDDDRGLGPAQPAAAGGAQPGGDVDGHGATSRPAARRRSARSAASSARVDTSVSSAASCVALGQDHVELRRGPRGEAVAGGGGAEPGGLDPGLGRGHRRASGHDLVPGVGDAIARGLIGPGDAEGLDPDRGAIDRRPDAAWPASSATTASTPMVPDSARRSPARWSSARWRSRPRSGRTRRARLTVRAPRARPGRRLGGGADLGLIGGGGEPGGQRRLGRGTSTGSAGGGPTDGDRRWRSRAGGAAVATTSSAASDGRVGVGDRRAEPGRRRAARPAGPRPGCSTSCQVGDRRRPAR
jgi:hypothetical protein